MTACRSPAFVRPLCLAFAAVALTIGLSGCGGSGDDGTSPPPATVVTISGKITFDRIPFKPAGTGRGLNPAAVIESPARQVTVEALDSSSGNAILATTATDDGGNYSLQVPANRNVTIRAKAEMVKAGTAPTWSFSVLNNANSGALYALDGDAASSGTSNTTRNLRATSGWGTTSYSGPRAAAPFAILDTIYAAKQLILSASAGTAFPALNLYWSINNRTVTQLCTANGNIGTTFYTPEVAALNSGNCTPNVAIPAGIYVLGDFAGGNGDTDEFDPHVIAHEFGHYIEDKFSRSDSIGGSHGPVDSLDLRVAFGEGWGNAYSGMALNDPLYRDSHTGISGESGFDMEASNAVTKGWFSEFSVTEILWDLFDDVKDGADQITLGFAPIYAVMTNAQRTTDALTSIYSFSNALRTQNAGQASGINALLTGESIAVTDAFGQGEINDGGSLTALPIYGDIFVNDPQIVVCGTGSAEGRNRLGYRRFLRLNLTTRSALTITAIGVQGVVQGAPATVAATDPDINVYRNGTIVAFGQETTPGTERIEQQIFDPGLHIIEVFDFDLGIAPRCMSVSVAGTGL